MNNYLPSQDLPKNEGKINGEPFSVFFERLRTGGVAVCGLGTANLPVLDWLIARGIRNITARDRRRSVLSLEKIASLSAQGVRFLAGDGYLENLTEGTIFRTPSLRPDTPVLLAAAARGACITSEAALFFALCPATLLAVTGSDGKTTTTLLTGEMLRAAGHRAFVGGNIGTPLLPYASLMGPEDFAVLELSSFQLMDLPPRAARSVITNITENHLDWHTGMAEYPEAKSHILGACPVLNADCARTLALASSHGVLFSSRMGREALLALGGENAIFAQDGWVVAHDGAPCRLFPTAALTLPGRYNLENAMAAAGLCLPYVPPTAMEAAVRRFRGAPQRMQYVGTFHGVACYDSSIDTTPARTAAALSAFPGKPVVIVGGRRKGLSYAPPADALAAYAGAVVLTGETADEIYACLRAHPAAASLPVVRESFFSDAVRAALRLASAGGAVVLSPACTSYDSFTDYAERGRAFAALCRTL